MSESAASTATPPVLVVDPPVSPPVEGLAHRVLVKVENRTPDALALEDLATDGPHDGRHSWRAPPFGIVVYDAAKDQYAHHTDASGFGAVPIESGVVPPGCTAEALLPLRALVPGRRRVRVTLRARAVPAAELGARLYLPPETMEGRQTFYRLGRERAARAAEIPLGRSILRAAPAREVVLAVELDVETIEDADAPGRLAAAKGTLVERSRALGKRWIVARDGRLAAVSGDRVDDLGGVTLEALRRIDDLAPGEPVAIVFRGEPALAVEKTLTLEGGGHGQRWFEREDAPRVLAVLAASGLPVGWGWHGVGAAGLVAGA